jgi:hypothetical protein
MAEAIKHLGLGACLFLGACHFPGAGVDKSAADLSGPAARRVTIAARGASVPGYSILLPAELERQPAEDGLFTGGGMLFTSA